MKRIAILTIFPEAFDSFLAGPVIRRAIQKELVTIEIVDIRAYADGSYRHIDDSPYGGGAGMIMRCEPVIAALRSTSKPNSRKLFFAPSGKTYSQTMAHELALQDDLILLCGHYEGMDARIEPYFDGSISLGDYILTGGELPAMIVTESPKMERTWPSPAFADSYRQATVEGSTIMKTGSLSAYWLERYPSIPPAIAPTPACRKTWVGIIPASCSHTSSPMVK